MSWFTYKENVHWIEHWLDLILFLNNSTISIPLDWKLIWSCAKRSSDIIKLIKTKIELGEIDEFVL